MNWPIKSFKVHDLLLDIQNIRIPVIHPGQDALVIDLFENERAFDLVESISKFGMFPEEFPIGVKEKGHVVIIEGNRRLAALKSLLAPEIIPSFEKKIRALPNPKIERINVVLAPSKEEAIRHIANRHTINYRRPWEPLRQAFFYQSQLNNGRTIKELKELYPEQDVISFIRRLEGYRLALSIDYGDDEVNKAIRNEREFPITTLERFLEDKQSRAKFGIKFDEDGQVHGEIEKTEFDKPFKRLVTEIVKGNITSRNSNNADERKENFWDKLTEDELPDPSKPGSFTSKDFDLKPADSKKKKLPVPKQERSNPLPTGFFRAADLPFKISSTPLRMMYEEAKNIPVKSYPNAAHDFLRSFLECSLVFYFKGTGEWSKIEKNSTHNATLNEILTFAMSPKCTSLDADVKEVITHIKAGNGTNFSLARLNMINHSENLVSSEGEARAAWGKMEIIFKKILNP